MNDFQVVNYITQDGFNLTGNTVSRTDWFLISYFYHNNSVINR